MMVGTLFPSGKQKTKEEKQQNKSIREPPITLRTYCYGNDNNDSSSDSRATPAGHRVSLNTQKGSFVDCDNNGDQFATKNPPSTGRVRRSSLNAIQSSVLCDNSGGEFSSMNSPTTGRVPGKLPLVDKNRFRGLSELRIQQNQVLARFQRKIQEQYANDNSSCRFRREALISSNHHLNNSVCTFDDDTSTMSELTMDRESNRGKISQYGQQELHEFVATLKVELAQVKSELDVAKLHLRRKDEQLQEASKNNIKLNQKVSILERQLLLLQMGQTSLSSTTVTSLPTSLSLASTTCKNNMSPIYLDEDDANKGVE